MKMGSMSMGGESTALIFLVTWYASSGAWFTGSNDGPRVESP